MRGSAALTQILSRVLALGNYLNGTSARGGAYGFKLGDLSKLVQVKSSDSRTTLLHYLARLLADGSDGKPGIAELKAELSKRGLSTAGRKRALARRLEDAVTGGR